MNPGRGHCRAPCGSDFIALGYRCAVVARYGLPAIGLLAILLSGCQSWRQRGPLSKPVEQCRQLSQRGQSAMARGDWAGAESILADAVKACPSDIDARRHYAEALSRRGERELALAHVEAALALANDDHDLLVRAGELNLELAKFAVAKQLAEEALDVEPRCAAAWALRAKVAVAGGDWETALADYHRALEYRPNDRQWLLDVAEIHRRANRPQRALTALASLRETYQSGEEPQQVYHLEGLALAALGRHHEAADALATAITRGPATTDLLHQLAQAQLAAGRGAAAQTTVQQALAIDPNHAPSLEMQNRLELATRPIGGWME